MWEEIPVFLYLMFSILLLPFGYNCLILAYGALKYKQPKAKRLKSYPQVTIQLPIFNERSLVKRLLEAISKLEWPRDRLDIQVLDDSTDETVSIINKEVEKLRKKGFKINVIRRKNRSGFKAGALKNGLALTKGAYVAIFDADFVPDRNFLLETIPHLEGDKSVGFVQARWGHLNRGINRFTETFSIGLDAHHIVDQAGRFSLGLLMSFNGSAGVLRTEAIKDVGNWESDTLSEDMDISYKMQLNGWKGIYLRDVVVDGEVPTTMSAFRIQQSRWSKGSIQCARKHLRRVWGSPYLSLFQKIQSTLQLTNYSISLLMMMIVLSGVTLMGYDCLIHPYYIPQTYFGQVLMDPRLGILFSICTFCTYVYYYTALKTQGLSMKRKAPYVGFLALIGHGMSAICALNIVEGIFVRGGVFERVPKHNFTGSLGLLKSRSYGSFMRFQGLEKLLVVYSALGLYFAYIVNLLPIASYLFIYLAGFYTVSNNI